MPDQEMPDIWKERTTLIVTAAYKDENGEPVAPTSAQYSMIDKRSGEVVINWTAIDLSPGDTSSIIEVTPEQMRILNDRRSEEPRLLTVQFTYGTARSGFEEYAFSIHNLVQAPIS